MQKKILLLTLSLFLLLPLAVVSESGPILRKREEVLCGESKRVFESAFNFGLNLGLKIGDRLVRMAQVTGPTTAEFKKTLGQLVYEEELRKAIKESTNVEVRKYYASPDEESEEAVDPAK